MPKLEYLNYGRSGYVIYKDGISTLQFYFEFSGGDCVATISVPTAEKWVKETKRPIADRKTILNFIADQVTREKVRGGYYEIKERFIGIFAKS